MRLSLFSVIILVIAVFVLFVRVSRMRRFESFFMRFQPIRKRLDKIRIMRKKPMDFLLSSLTWLFAAVTVTALVFIISYILYMGVPNLTPSLFQYTFTPDNQTMLPSIITTALLVLSALSIAIPIGVFSAIYLVEYARRGSLYVKIIRVMTENLTGIPSIVFGLFGYLLFVTILGFGYSLLSGTLTVALMVLPLIIRTTEESLKAVPDTYREGSFGLGAGRLRTVFRIVLPSAMPGILAGVILSVGRIVGETAALMFTLGMVTRVPEGIMDSGRTLAVHMYILTGEGMHVGAAYATASVLLLLVICINAISGFIAKKLVKK